jgi:lipid-A-disaccharide synthase
MQHELSNPLRIAIVAGETSGDTLGAGLLRELYKRVPIESVEGICGPLMCQEGAISLFEMESISIMGLDGLFGNVNKILGIRRSLIKRFLSNPPDIFIGIDVPDFNLGLEKKLREAGIKTVHYVSPTVWAWRGYRIHKIRKAVSRMLTLFPFEVDFYQQHNVPVSFVGHPVADEIEVSSRQQSRAALAIDANKPVVALLPGSRRSEVSRLAPVFADTALALQNTIDNLHFVIPCASKSVRPLLEDLLCSKLPAESYQLIDANARQALTAADVALLASGTAALEAALLSTPMVVAYKVSRASYLMVKSFSTVKHYSMPNHLLDEPIVSEFIQADATADRLAPAVLELLQDESANMLMREKLGKILGSLRCNASALAAEAVISECQKITSN